MHGVKLCWNVVHCTYYLHVLLFGLSFHLDVMRDVFWYLNCSMRLTARFSYCAWIGGVIMYSFAQWKPRCNVTKAMILLQLLAAISPMVIWAFRIHWSCQLSWWQAPCCWICPEESVQSLRKILIKGAQKKRFTNSTTCKYFYWYFEHSMVMSKRKLRESKIYSRIKMSNLYHPR